ncbi:GtrA family protein [Raineyella sp. LH-20]|uniref:GtrA family protein n=1 Tax=Raineyella sp. LH-20 TaxID=3081204 RepID=UPI002953224D|nr:GtrA family protein [Raineyella sp. LH-20]WOP19838.1 GtrA family protein [Raineyella sp. LH-20]
MVGFARVWWLRLWPLVKFCLVGVVNTGVYYGVYLVVLRFLPYPVAHLIGWTVSVVVSYLLNCVFTYRVRPTWRKLLVYPLSSLPNVLFTTFGVVLLIEVFHVGERLAPLIAGLAAVPFSYLLARLLLVGRGKQEPDSAGAVDEAVVGEAAVSEDGAPGDAGTARWRS